MAVSHIHATKHISYRNRLRRQLSPYSRVYALYFKRAFDFLTSAFFLIALFPVLILLTVLLMVFQGGNPFFLQERIGYNCRKFKIIKFRTMTFKKNAEGQLLPDEARVTWIGRIMRSTSLDELPELMNVLIGDMSIVGPRPWLEEKLTIFSESTKQRRMKIRPGVTGLAQIMGRNSLTYRQRVAYDLRYQKHLSFLLDLKILSYTVYKVFIREGIYERPDALGKPLLSTVPKDIETKGRKMNKPDSSI